MQMIALPTSMEQRCTSFVEMFHARLRVSRAGTLRALYPGTLRALVLLLVFALAGCGSNRLVIAEEQIKVEPWFCQVSEHDNTWDCVQDEDLARDPQPDRMPIAVSGESTEAQTQPDAPIADSADADTPRYQQLAYRPTEPTSLLELPKSYWAAQLIALPSRDLLEEYANEHGLDGASAARVAVRDNLFYVLLLGIYESKEIAEEAIANLPPPFDVDKPWLRSLESLQQAMIEGNEIAGSSLL